MHDIAQRSEKDRRELFRAAAQQMHIHEAILEKDFWVCWVLKYLFEDSPWLDQMAFKGGTSLSKAYGAIERFSEDIDLVLDWRLLGYSEDDAWAKRSGSKQDAFSDEANRRTAELLTRDFVPIIRPALMDRAGVDVGVESQGQDILIQYPKAFSLGSIQPQIRLEIGPLAAWIPNEKKEIRPYSAEQFPSLFSRPNVIVRTITAERTFWEKATILHQEAHRGAEKPLPPRYSRHYYDLYRLSCLPIREQALARFNLLGEVVRFKMRFYRCNWAKYEEATQGNLRLLPPEHHIAELKKDYIAMRAMLFGSIPSFEDIMTELAVLEITINKTACLS
jgi:hypothetical protein